MMQLQTTFYILGIIYMALNVLILLGIGVGIFIIVRKVVDIHHQVSEKLTLIEKALKHPDDMAVQVGANFTGAAINKVREALDKNKKHKKIQ